MKLRAGAGVALGIDRPEPPYDKVAREDCVRPSFSREGRHMVMQWPVSGCKDNLHASPGTAKPAVLCYQASERIVVTCESE